MFVCEKFVCFEHADWKEFARMLWKITSYLAMLPNRTSALHQKRTYLSFGPQIFKIFVCYDVIYDGNLPRSGSRHFEPSLDLLVSQTVA